MTNKSFYELAIATNRAKQGGSGMGFSKATTFLTKPETIWEYYQTNLNNFRKARTDKQIARCVKAVKQLPNGKWRLKLQTGKYAHPLLIDDDNTSHTEMNDFETKEDAMEMWQVWIDSLRNKDRGILDAIKEAYKDYATANEVYNQELYTSYFGEGRDVA